jgi:hypothetical protein
MEQQARRGAGWLPLRLVVAGVFCWHACACKGPTQVAERLPRLDIDATEHDFGEVLQNTSLQHTFRLANQGGTDLVVERIDPCCGVTAVLGGPARIRPGETRSLSLFTPAFAFPGRNSRVLEIQTNDPRRRKVSVRVFWKITIRTRAVPSSLDWAETMRIGDSSKVVDFMNIPRDFRIIEFRATSQALRAEVVRVPKDAAYRRIKVRLNSSALPIGEFRAQLGVRTNTSFWSWVTIPVRATVVDAIDIRPSRLFLGLVGLRSRPVAQSVVHVNASNPSRVRLVPPFPRCFSVALRPVGGGRSYLLTATPRVPLPPGRFADVVHLRALNRELTVSITGLVEPSLERAHEKRESLE